MKRRGGRAMNAERRRGSPRSPFCSLASAASLPLLCSLALLGSLASACGDSSAPAPASAPASSASAAIAADQAAAAAQASLTAAVTALFAAPADEQQRAVAQLKLDPLAFSDVLTAPYDLQYSAYDARFTAAAPAFAAELRRLAAAPAASAAAPAAPTITVRRHYAGDRTLSLEQARLRWALPVQAESWLVERGGVLLDAVWVRHRGRWFTLMGLDAAVLQLLATAAPECAAAARRAGPPGVCSDATWMALDAAMRGVDDRVARACERAVHFCR